MGTGFLLSGRGNVLYVLFIYFRYSTVSIDTVCFGSTYKLVKYKPRHRACEGSDLGRKTGHIRGEWGAPGGLGRPWGGGKTVGGGLGSGTEGFGCAAQS